MKRWIELLLTFALVFSVACGSTTPDPDNGVSNASYRQAIAKSEKDIAHITSDMEKAALEDAVSGAPVHSPVWWQALIDELASSRDLLHDTLLGSNK
jgi:hypothetical protein